MSRGVDGGIHALLSTKLGIELLPELVIARVGRDILASQPAISFRIGLQTLSSLYPFGELRISTSAFIAPIDSVSEFFAKFHGTYTSPLNTNWLCRQ